MKNHPKKIDIYIHACSMLSQLYTGSPTALINTILLIHTTLPKSGESLKEYRKLFKKLHVNGFCKKTCCNREPFLVQELY